MQIRKIKKNLRGGNSLLRIKKNCLNFVTKVNPSTRARYYNNIQFVLGKVSEADVLCCYLEKWTAYGAKNWEGGLAGGLL